MFPKLTGSDERLACSQLAAATNVKLLSRCHLRRVKIVTARVQPGTFPVSRLVFSANRRLFANYLTLVRTPAVKGGAENSASTLHSLLKPAIRNGFKFFPTVNAAEAPAVPEAVATSDPPPAETEQDPKPKMSFGPLPGQTGWDRLQEMYSMDIYGGLGPEWSLIKQGTQGGVIAGVVAGVMIGGREARLQHLDTSHATVYHNEMAGRRALQDKMTLGMMRGGLRWGWRTCAFTTMYLAIATHMSVFRGSTSFVDFVVAGVAVGSAAKFMQGPIAALTAGAVGGVLGLVSGSISMGVLKLSGISFEQLRYEHYQLQPKFRSEIQGRFDMPSPPPNEYKSAASDSKNELTTVKESQPESKPPA